MAKNDDWAMPPVGWLAVAGIGFLALKAFRGGGQAAPAPQGRGAPGRPQQPPGTMLIDDANPAMGGGLMGMGPNGIPVVALPVESAQRSRMIKTAPSWDQIKGQAQVADPSDQAGQPAAPAAHPYSGESFGGMDASGMGESF